MYSKITISGKICTGKSSVFRELLEKLKWPTFSSGAYFREYSKSHNLELNNAEEQTNILTRKVDGMVKEMLHKPGHLLLDAWLGGVLAEGTNDVLTVLLTADDSIRFKRFAEREKVSLEVAQKEVILRDSSWFEKVKKIHNRSDFFDKKNYNLIIDTSHLDIDHIASLILKKLS
ncbi:MAG: cytidylate kinase family protein [Candidatus Roizmanbacteria bacterium]|nr:cytidylate kinase family protein [Candidatus Roizmanbacteria bacterium]